MKKLSFTLIAILMAITGLTSCSSQEDEPSVAALETKASNKVTVEEAKVNALDFVANLKKSNTRAFSAENISIANVKPVAFKRETRTVSSLSTDTLFYIVNFSDSCGFAIVSADKHDTPIQAFVEEGNYDYDEIDSINPGFEAFMCAMVDRAVNKNDEFTIMPKDDIDGGGGSGNSRSNGTSADPEEAVNKMRDEFGFNATGLSDYNVDDVITELKSGNKIVLMRGNGRYYHVAFVVRKYVDGHAWVVDGYIDQVKNNQESKYVHYNWGWGPQTKNGYFLSDVLNAEEAPVYDDNVTSSTRSNNFRYKLKTATFTK